MFPYVIETLVEVWKNSKLRGNTRPMGFQNFTRVSITVWKHRKCFRILELYILEFYCG